MPVRILPYPEVTRIIDSHHFTNLDYYPEIFSFHRRANGFWNEAGTVTTYGPSKSTVKDFALGAVNANAIPSIHRKTNR